MTLQEVATLHSASILETFAHYMLRISKPIRQRGWLTVRLNLSSKERNVEEVNTLQEKAPTRLTML